MATAATLALAPVALLVGAAPAANAAGSGLVISEVYGAGGNPGATWNQDWIELHNPTDAAIDVSGLSVQYRSATGTANPSGVTALTGSVPAHAYYVVAEAKGATGAPLPRADVTGNINLSGSTGTVFLANQAGVLTSPPTGSVVDNPAVLDLVGFGTSNTYEKAVAPAPSSSSSIARDAKGVDTNDNASDFTAGAGTPGAAAEEGSTEPPTVVPKTIEEIQGTGTASPLVGQTVQTSGVVTAAYPTGGFNGFYLQTPGTGGDVDPAGHQASDAVFVFSAAAAKTVRIGDHVQVTGKVSEFNGLTEVSPAAASDVVHLDTPAETVKPAVIDWPRTDVQRETFEGMLLAPRGEFVVADNYSLNNFAEIGLASGDHPLWQPTEVADPHDAAAIAAVNADNAVRKLALDDGASANFLTTAKDTPLPWLTQDREIRVGAKVTFASPLVLDWRNATWKLQPTSQLTAADPLPVSFANTRTAAPKPTGGNVHLASFNMLNYFTTTGADFVAGGGTCTWYDDRAGQHVTVRTCTGPQGQDGPRGAADAANLARQQAKEVRAINALGADVVSLEEIENSARFGQDRDAAVRTLVAALNADAGAGTWAFVPTPASAGDQSDEDVIRTAFIYKQAAVEPVGDSVIDDVPVFDVARDPLAQAFRPVGGAAGSEFVVIVNHFKSKGSGPDDGTGQGNSNPQRIVQAQELVGFANAMKTTAGTDKVFLAGDFNAYTQEDPIKVLRDAGFTDIGSAKSPEEHTYLFDGVVGSLDHVLANQAAFATVTGAHVWNINSVESVALEYSRYNYNATDFYQPTPYRSSDHDPLVVGLQLPLKPTAPATTTTRATVTPRPVEFKRDHPVVTVRVTSAAGVVEGGVVQVLEHGRVVGTATVAGGVARVVLPTTNKKGGHVLSVRYLGTSTQAPSATTATYVVVKSKHGHHRGHRGGHR